MAETLYQIRIKQQDDQRATIQYVSLDDTVIGIKAQWVKYTNTWHIWLLDIDGSQIAGPIRLVPGIDLLRPFKHLDRVPQGQLFCYSPDRSPPTATNIDSESLVLYRAVS